METQIDCKIVQKCLEVLQSPCRYGVIHGGRGKGASWSVARFSILETAFNPILNLCTREFQNSIKDSTHKLLCDQIGEMKVGGLPMSRFFDITKDSIRSIVGGEFIFRGLHDNQNSIKSIEGIDRCYIEEAHDVSKASLDVLFPTIRKAGSKIRIVFNPEDENSEVHRRFVEPTDPELRRIWTPPNDCIVREVSFDDNPWFPEVLRREMEYDRRVDPEKFQHVWMGKVKGYAQACIFNGKIFVEEFEAPEGTQFFYGADFGFSVDPTCLIRMWVKDRVLFIDYEAYGIGVEIEDLPAFFRSVPEAERWRIIADSARPETISFLNQKGFNIDGAKKGKGSVEDGIEFLRSFERIVIHPRCKGSIGDFKNYKWKRDRMSDRILPIPLDASNHSVDSARYALEDYSTSTAVFYWSP